MPQKSRVSSTASPPNTSEIIAQAPATARFAAWRVLVICGSDIVQAEVNIINQRRCWPLKHREFIYVGEPVPKIDIAENADFVLGYQKSILLSLVKRKLLSQTQCERCAEELEPRLNRL